MIRIIPFAKDEIILDPAGAAKALTKSMGRYPGYHFTCLVPTKHEILILLEESDFLSGEDEGEFVFSAMNCGETEAEIAGAASGRYMGGYSTKGTFHLNRQLWGLFFRPADWKKRG